MDHGGGGGLGRVGQVLGEALAGRVLLGDRQAEAAVKATARAGMRSACLSFMPYLRVNHAAWWAARDGALAVYRIAMRFSRCLPTHRSFAHLRACGLLPLHLFCCAARHARLPAPNRLRPAAKTQAKSRRRTSRAADKERCRPCLPRRMRSRSIELDGKKLKYTVTVGALPVRDKDGKTAGQVVVTAYTVEGENRPVTFAFNGGPGASSVYLNFGAIGPKHLQVGNEGDSPSDPPCSRTIPAPGWTSPIWCSLIPSAPDSAASSVPEAEAKKLFYSTTPDIEYLSRIIYDWLVKNDRLGSKKVSRRRELRRIPRAAHHLLPAVATGVAMNGVVLVSPYLNPTIEDNGDLSPVPWMMTLPSITAAHLERENKLTPQAMADVIAYTRGEYATTLLKGRSDPEAQQKMISM